MDKLQMGCTNNQYPVFINITNAQLTSISKQQKKMRKYIKMTHHMNTGNLIIKLMPLMNHKAAYLNLAKVFQWLVALIDISYTNKLAIVREILNFGFRSFKQPNKAYKPRFCPKAVWPTIIFKFGFFKEITWLRVDAK